MCELLVGLADVTVLGVIDHPNGPLEVHVESRTLDRVCTGCGLAGQIKDRRQVALVDLPCFGRPTRLVWGKVRLTCVNTSCSMESWTIIDRRIAYPRMRLTDRAGRWVTEQIGRYGRSVDDVAAELGCDWHTINDTVAACGQALVDDPDRIGATDGLGMDETLFVKRGRWRTKTWCTSLVDVRAGRLLDIIEGRSPGEPCKWLTKRGESWCDRIIWGTLDMSGPYRAVFDTMLGDAVQIADPFHVHKLANSKLDDVRRQVQNETTGHRGRADDPLYRARRLLVMADERLNDAGRDRLVGLLAAGDPKGEVRMAWHAKQVVRSIYDHDNAGVALECVDRLGLDLQDESQPPEMHQLDRTLRRWRHRIANWHKAHLTNAPTEAANNLIKRIKRVSVNRPWMARGSVVRDAWPGVRETAMAGRIGGRRCVSSESMGATGSWVAICAMSSWRTRSCRTWTCERSLR